MSHPFNIHVRRSASPPSRPAGIMAKSVQLGHRLRYPITITRLLKSRGDTVKKQEPIMQYSFKWMADVGDPIAGDTWQEEQTTFVDWESPVDGEIKEWRVKAGEVIKQDRDCLVVKEACSHEIQFQGLCAICGKDMTEVNWATEQRDTDRAPINMTHDATSLTVSELAARRAETELQRRLLEQRKLSLVVDLDQTIIHACIEPTIGEWQSDPNNPNYEAVKDVKSFQLSDEGVRAPRGVTSGCWYYIKMRPGLMNFLERISMMYELHVYTMGTRAYAKSIANIVDPQSKLFGNRVISRDENGNMTAKSLQRLFPVSTNMVVIIDDRADVWPRNRPNLIKVTPYDFFKGVGDINSSFLPKREDLLAPSPDPQAKAIAPKPAQNGASAPEASSKVSALESLASMSNGDDTDLLKLQTEEQERELEKQLTERPLLHMQEQLDKEDEEAEKTTPEVEATNGQQTTPSHQRHHLLLDDDVELKYLEQHLTNLHHAFYEVYDSRTDSLAVPDVGAVLDRLKAKVLQGTTIVLSGLVPLGVDVLKSELGLQAVNFGAQIHSRISRRVTHLVISSNRPRTQKVRQAAQIPSIKIVNQNWLADCLSQWRMLDETPYLVDLHPADRAGALVSGTIETADADTISDIDTDSEINEPHLRRPGTLKILVTGPQKGYFDREDLDDEDDDPTFDDNGPTSPIETLQNFDWGEADQEMAEFLGEDDDESDFGESEANSESEGETDTGTTRGAKRKLGEDDGDSDGSVEHESVLAKKQRLARERGGSSLRAVRTPDAADETNSLPTPNGTNDDEEVLLVKNMPASQTSKAADDLDDDDLEADLLAELEAEEHMADKG